MENVRGGVTFQGRLSKLQEPSCMVATSFISEFPWRWLLIIALGVFEIKVQEHKSQNPVYQVSEKHDYICSLYAIYLRIDVLTSFSERRQGEAIIEGVRLL